MSKTPMPRAARALAATLLVLTITHSSAADGGETNLYWSQRLGLDRATIDGKETRPIVRDAFAVVDPRGVKLYWNDLDLNQVLRSNIDGSEIERAVCGDVFRPTGLAVDPVEDKLYWVERGLRRLKRASLDGTNDENVGDLEFANALAFGASVVPGDVDGDGLTGFTDLVAILGTWGPCPCNDACISDLDLSGGVGMNDLTFLLGHWGATR